MRTHWPTNIGGIRTRDWTLTVPEHYFPNDDPTQPPVVNWRSAGQLIYNNWLNYYVYQTTPYDLNKLSETEK